jgi:hypothetical protein
MTNPSHDRLREHEGGPELPTARRPGGRRTRRTSLCDCCRSGPGDRPAPFGSGDELRLRRLSSRDGLRFSRLLLLPMLSAEELLSVRR